VEGLRADLGSAYITFNRYNDELQAFQLVGDRYKMELLGERAWLSLKLGLALWEGEYRGALRQWLRWYNAEGNLVPQAEMVQQAEQQTEQEQQRELAEQRANQLAQRLRDLDSNLTNVIAMPKRSIPDIQIVSVRSYKYPNCFTHSCT